MTLHIFNNWKTIDTNANVGIGTTTPHAYPGYTTLAIDGSTGSLLALDSSNTHIAEISAATTGLSILHMVGLCQ